MAGVEASTWFWTAFGIGFGRHRVIMAAGGAQQQRRALGLRRLGAQISSWLLVLVPLLSLPCLLIEPSRPAVGRTAFSIAVMAGYWAFEVLPIAVTALLPLILFPLLGVMPATEVSINYFKDQVRFAHRSVHTSPMAEPIASSTHAPLLRRQPLQLLLAPGGLARADRPTSPPSQNILFFGGLVIAAALEVVRAHERIALSTLLIFGTRPRKLLLGFMLVTAFLSMWMNNTATCAVRSLLAALHGPHATPLARGCRPHMQPTARDHVGAQGGRWWGTAAHSWRGKLRSAAPMREIDPQLAPDLPPPRPYNINHRAPAHPLFPSRGV
jgi:hypothetical protein